MDDALLTLLDKQAIRDLCSRYMRGLDRLDETLLRSTFWEDAWCDYGFVRGPASEFAGYCMEALAGHAANHHMIGQVLIDLAGDEAFGEVYFNAYHKVPVDSGHEDVIIAGRYLDRYEKRGDEWRFAYRSERVDFSHTRPTNDSYFDLVPDSLRGGRQDDAVYRREDRYRPQAITRE